MAFIGKKQADSSGNKKPNASVSFCEGRIGVVLRGPYVKAGTLIDVLVGTDEDFGLLMIKIGEGTPCKAFGKKAQAVSWSASRAASKIYPNMTRTAATIIDGDETHIILQITALRGEENE